MGACTSKYKPLYTILCDKDGIIINATVPLLEKLNYRFDTLNGKFIGILMSDFMSMLHKKYFINMWNISKGVEKNRLENKLKALHHKRSLLIYDINGNAHTVSVSIQYSIPFGNFYKPVEATNSFIITFDFLKESSDLFYTGILKENSVHFKLNKTDTVIIYMDFIKSTELLHDKGVVNLIDISIRFYKEIIELIRTKYYPFVYLHEIVGDSFVLALNTDWIYNTDKFCATLAVNFMVDLIQKTREFIKIRTGIGYGKIHYGTIGSSFSFFGFPMNIAARLENKCNENQINVSDMFYNKLIGEFDTLLLSDMKCVFSKNTADLKGLGTTDYYTLNVSEDQPFLIYR